MMSLAVAERVLYTIFERSGGGAEVTPAPFPCSNIQKKPCCARVRISPTSETPFTIIDLSDFFNK